MNLLSNNIRTLESNEKQKTKNKKQKTLAPNQYAIFWKNKWY